MKKMINETHVSGLLYEHNLKVSVSGNNSKHPGTTFISGTVSIATDNNLTNIVPIHYTYVTEKTSTGRDNFTFRVLNDIYEGRIKSVMEHGAANAMKVIADSAIGLNEFYSNRNGNDELVSAKRNEGGFIQTVSTIEENESDRSHFVCDFVVLKTRRIEADEERGIPEKVIVEGVTFDFRNSLLPISLVCTSPGAMDYFEGLNASASNPTFTKVWGNQISETVVIKKTEESAFGEPLVREIRSSRKEFLITGANAIPYEWDETSTITAQEWKEALARREMTVAELKTRQLEYEKSKKTATMTPSISNFSF